MGKRKSRRSKEGRHLKNLKKPARQRVRHVWGMNPVDRVKDAKRGRGAQYNRQQRRKETWKMEELKSSDYKTSELVFLQ